MENIKVLTNTLLKETQTKAYEICKFEDEVDAPNDIDINDLIFIDYPYDISFYEYIAKYDEDLEEILVYEDSIVVLQYIEYVNTIYELYKRLLQNLEKRSGYTILEKECYNSGGNIYIGDITVKKDNDLYIFCYSDNSGYGCYKTSYEKGLELRNTKDILSHFDINGYPSFGDLLSDSDILNENFEFVESDEECDLDYEKEIYEYLNSKIDKLFNAPCNEEDVIFNEVKVIRDAYPSIVCNEESYSCTEFILEIKNELMNIANHCINNQEYDDAKEVIEDLKKLDYLKIQLETINNKNSYKNELQNFLSHMYDVLDKSEECDFENTYDFEIKLKDKSINLDFGADVFQAIQEIIECEIENY